MKLVNVQISPGLLGAVLKTARQVRTETMAQRQTLDQEIAELDSQIAGLEKLIVSDGVAPKNDAPLLTFHDTIPKPNLSRSGRVRRGQSERLVESFLHTRNGAGASIREIIDGTGTKYGTVHRLMKTFEEKGRVRQDDKSRWHLITK
jgi:predicted transcriptional regulator